MLWVILGLFAVITIWAISVYNGLIAARNAFKNAFAQIEVQLQRRYDLIPTLVENVKGYLQFERETLERVIQARALAVSGLSAARANPGDPAAMQQLSGADNMLTQALGRLFAVAEAYPDLKANQTVLALQEELTSTENRIAFARQAYNDAVMNYNNRREMFPGNLVAGFFGFGPGALLEVESPEARRAPRVSLIR